MKKIAILYFMVGALLYASMCMCRGFISDFILGFFEGVAAVFIFGSTIYMIWYFLKKEDPRKLKK